MVVGWGELADTHTNYQGPALIQSLQLTKPVHTEKPSLHMHIQISNWSPVCCEILSPGVEAFQTFVSWATQQQTKIPSQFFKPLKFYHVAQNVSLTKGVDSRFARDRSKLWWATRSWGVGLLRHGRSWLHTWSTGLLSLPKAKRALAQERKQVDCENKINGLLLSRFKGEKISEPQEGKKEKHTN